MFFLLQLLVLIPVDLAYPAPPQRVNLKVNIGNVRTPKGAVYVALFRADNSFPSGKPLEGKKLPIAGRSVQTAFSVDPGDYALAVYHDENDNGKLDTRLFGIPKEPYGFSNNFRPVMSAPKSKDCGFSVGDGGRAISIELN